MKWYFCCFNIYMGLLMQYVFCILRPPPLMETLHHAPSGHDEQCWHLMIRIELQLFDVETQRLRIIYLRNVVSLSSIHFLAFSKSQSGNKKGPISSLIFSTKNSSVMETPLLLPICEHLQCIVTNCNRHKPACHREQKVHEDSWKDQTSSSISRKDW